MESLVHAYDIRSGRTTDATTVPAEKIYNFWSDRWIAPKFLRVSGGSFPWSSVESLLHVNDVRSGRTTNATTVPAERVHNFWSDCWIELKFLEEFL